MDIRHPNLETISLFRAGALPEQEGHAVGWHLYQCATCRRELETTAPGRTLLVQLFSEFQEPQPRAESSYDSVISRTFSLLLEREVELEQDRELAPVLYDELAQHPQFRQEVLIANTRRYQTWGLAEAFLKACARCWFKDPARAEVKAELALKVAHSLTPPRYSRKLLHDLKARCWMHVANSRRVSSNLRSAEQAFEVAEEHLQQGTDDPLERAHLLRFQSSLRRDQLIFDEAKQMLNRAYNTYRRVGDTHMAGKAMMNLANLHKAMGEPEQAIEVLAKAMGLIDAEREPLLTLGSHHNLIDYLADAGRFLEARAQLIEARPLYELYADEPMQRRWLWVQGKIASGLGQLNHAEKLLDGVLREYVAQDLGYDAALVSLELAMVYARQDRLAQMKELAEETMTLFRALDIHREALAALLLFQEAAEAEQVTLTMLRDLAARVRDSRDGLPSHLTPSE